MNVNEQMTGYSYLLVILFKLKCRTKTTSAMYDVHHTAYVQVWCGCVVEVRQYVENIVTSPQTLHELN